MTIELETYITSAFSWIALPMLHERQKMRESDNGDE